jgi:voltage-gated potassium channel
MEEILIRANTKSARCLVTLIPRDAENLYVAMAARDLSADLYIVCRTEDESAEKRLLKAGANRVISPYRVGGQKIARAVLKPYVSELVDIASSKEHGSLQIEELKIPRTSSLCGKTIREADVRRESNVIILSLIKSDGTVVFNPNGEESFAAESTVVILGSKGDLGQFEKLVLG